LINLQSGQKTDKDMNLLQDNWSSP